MVIVRIEWNDVQVENLIVEVEGELENDADNAKTADSCDKFKRALENQSDPLAVHSREKTPGIESLVNYTSKERPNKENVCETHELELLEDGETIPVEDLGRIDDSGHEKIVEDELQEKPHTACCVGEENVVDILLNLSKGDIPDTEQLKEERREEEENVNPRTLRTEMSDSDIEPISMRPRCVAGRSKKAQSRGVDSPKKLPSLEGANPEKTKSQNVDSSKNLSPPKGANPEKIAQARNEKSTASKKSTQVSGGKFTNFTFEITLDS